MILLYNHISVKMRTVTHQRMNLWQFFCGWSELAHSTIYNQEHVCRLGLDCAEDEFGGYYGCSNGLENVIWIERDIKRDIIYH